MKHEPVVPEHSIEWCGAGKTAVLRPADLVLVRHNKGVLGSAIRFGEKLHGGGEWAWTNHAAIAIDRTKVVEETARGAVVTEISEWHDVVYCVVRPKVQERDKNEAVHFAHWCVGWRYSWLSILGLILDMTLGLRVTVGTEGRMICSALACRAHERLGLVPDKTPEMVTPADLARYYEVKWRQQYELWELSTQSKEQ